MSKLRSISGNRTIEFGTVILLMVMLALSACNTSPNAAATKAPTGYFRLGEQVKVDNAWAVTLHSDQRNAGNKQNKPKSGDTYIMLDVSLANIATKVGEVSSLLQFTLKDQSGQAYSETITNFAKPPDGQITPGSTVEGKFLYEVPASLHTFTFSFTNDTSRGWQANWRIVL